MMKQICRDSWIVDDSSLKPACVLGRGSYGSVTLMEDPQFRCYAKKTSSMHLLKNLQRELNIMLHFHDHPCIVRAKSPFIYFKNNTEGERVCYIYIEYANKRTLHNMISGFRGKTIPEYMIQRAARMILQGLEALHSHGYVHCDLKPSNILLFPSTTFGDPFDLKLADFGLSKEPNSTSAPLRSSKRLGTLQYMPPDTFGPNGVVIDSAFDIYSLGCVVYEMFGAKPMQELSDDFYEWHLFTEISPVARDFLSRCHALHPLFKSEKLDCPVRATAAELLNHPFITQSLTVPLPTDPIPPTTRQQEDFPMIPKLPGSIW